MRVITGLARGRRLRTLEGADVRPTTDMVKEAMFSVIQFDVQGSVVLDLFSGSGQLGIEALSRGAKYCRFVDKSRASAEVTSENISVCGFNNDGAVTVADSIEFLRNVRMTFDVALLDPPYGKGLLEEALPLLEKKMSDRGVVVCEHEKELALPDEFDRLKKHKTYRYGKIAVTVYKILTPQTEEDED